MTKQKDKQIRELQIRRTNCHYALAFLFITTIVFCVLFFSYVNTSGKLHKQLQSCQEKVPACEEDTCFVDGLFGEIKYVRSIEILNNIRCVYTYDDGIEYTICHSIEESCEVIE